MLALTITIFGIISLFRLPIALMPAGERPVISIITHYHGVAPEQIEKLVTIPIEEAVSTISGIKELRSVSEEGKSTVVVNFEEGTKMKYAALNVSEAADRVSGSFPQACKKPYIMKNDPNRRAIYIINLKSGTLNVDEIRTYGERMLKSELLRIDGVSEVDLSGGSLKEIHIDVDYRALSSYNVPITDISEVVQKSYFVHSGGEIYESNRERTLFTDARFSSLEEMRELTLFYDEEGMRPVRLGEVARIYEGYREKDRLSRLDGEESVNIYIKKSGDANTLEVCSRLERYLEENSHSELNFRVVYSQGEFIERAIDNVKQAALLGAIIAVLVLFIFIKDWRAIALITFSIPFSLLFTFFLMYIFKVEINVMTLSGLALGTGMLLDNGTVMLKALSQDLEKGEFRRAGKMITPIISSTLTTVGVFIPFIFLSPELKRLYGGLALTVTFSLLSSVICALIIMPGGYGFLQRGEVKRVSYNSELSGRIVNFSLRGLNFLFRRLKFSLVVVSLLVVTALLTLIFMEREYVDPASGSEVTAFVELPSGTSLEETARIVRKVEDYFRSVKGIKQVSSRISKWHADIELKYEPSHFKGKSGFIELMKRETDSFKDCFVHYEERAESGAKEVNIDVIGDNDKRLRELAVEAAREAGRLSGVRTVVLKFKEGRPALTWEIDREKALSSGVSIVKAGEELRWGIYGPVALKYIKDSNEMDLRVSYSREYRDSLEEIVEEYAVYNRERREVKLKEIGTFSNRREPGRIFRKNRRKSVRIGVKLGDISLGDAVTKLEEELSKVELPEGYYFDYGDSLERLKESQRGGLLAIILSIFMVFAILTIQFNSFRIPLLIIPVIPASAALSIIVLELMDISLNISVFIGLVVLSGVVVNNSILIAEGVKGGERVSLLRIVRIIKGRLSPLLITTLTTVLALIPLIINRGEGSGFWRPLAVTLAVGLIGGMFINLAIFPFLLLRFGGKRESNSPLS